MQDGRAYGIGVETAEGASCMSRGIGILLNDLDDSTLVVVDRDMPGLRPQLDR